MATWPPRANQRGSNTFVMPDRIGIVACSAERSRLLCYQTICARRAAPRPHAHPKVSMHTHSLAKYVASIDRDGSQGVGELCSPPPTARDDRCRLPDLPQQSAPTRCFCSSNRACRCPGSNRRGRRRAGRRARLPTPRLTGNALARRERGLSGKAVARGWRYARPNAAECEEINRVSWTSWCTTASSPCYIPRGHDFASRRLDQTFREGVVSLKASVSFRLLVTHFCR